MAQWADDMMLQTGQGLRASRLVRIPSFGWMTGLLADGGQGLTWPGQRGGV
jgi:hypothetical protein